MKIPQEAYIALSMLNEKGYEAYLVGGCVRDGYMGREMNDIDITTSSLPWETKAVFEGFKVIETGIKHGTVTVYINHVPCEITTFRTESTYSDNRHPDAVIFTRTLSKDLSRRDFTMNALAADKDGNITDLYNGCEDIDKKIIRCIGDADSRLSEDALRIFRAVRFSSVLGFSVDGKTKESLFTNRELLRNIAAERIYTELLKTLAGKNIKNVLLEYIDIFAEVIPELKKLEGFEQYNRHHIYDVYTHTCLAVESIPQEPLLRLSRLLHDIAKPQTFSIDEKGTGHFYSHASKGCEMAKAIMKRLKASNADTEFVTDMVKYHDIQIEPTLKAVRRFMSKHGEYFTRKLVLMKRADNAAQNIKDYNYTEYYDKLDKLIDEIISEGQCFSLKQLAVNGQDIMKAGIPRGRIIGEILNELLAKVVDGKLENSKEQLIIRAQKIYSEKVKE